MKQQIINNTPHFLKKIYRYFFLKPAASGWQGDYSSWHAAQQKCSGYDDYVILEKVKAAVLKVKNGEAVYERDSVLFDKLEYEAPLLKAFEQCAKENDQHLHVIDFGGSLGSSYFQYRGLLKELKDLRWSVVEQSHFVKCGKETIADNILNFFNSIEEALLNKKPHVLYLGSVIQYFEKPFELISKCLEYNFEYIIIDRTAFIENSNHRITIQVVPEDIYKASYPAWFFNEEKFLDALEGKYEIVDSFLSEVSRPEKLKDNKNIYWKGFILKKVL